MTRISSLVSFLAFINVVILVVEKPLSGSDAFVIGARSKGPLSIYPRNAIQNADNVNLNAKKRRRKNGETGNSDDLPDFDLLDDSVPVQPAKEETTRKLAETRQPSTEITANMMGSTSKPTRNVQQLIKDRSLEKKLQFDDRGDPSIPDFTDLALGNAPKGSSLAPETGKKKARQLERQLRAREAEEKDQPSILSKIPFITNEEGKVEPLKVIEAGTWAGIFLLVAWEVYINSPFFDRVAPMAPVVY